MRKRDQKNSDVEVFYARVLYRTTGSVHFDVVCQRCYCIGDLGLGNKGGNLALPDGRVGRVLLQNPVIQFDGFLVPGRMAI